MPATAVTGTRRRRWQGSCHRPFDQHRRIVHFERHPTARYFEGEPGGRGDVRIGRRGRGNVADAASRGMKVSTQIPPRSPRSRRRRDHAWLCHLLASTHPRLRLRRPGARTGSNAAKPSTRPPHPTARRTRLLRHPEQDRVGRSPAVIYFTECLRSVGVICRPASSTVPGWKTGPSTTRPIPATSSGRSSSHCCRRRGPAGDRRNTRVDSATFRRNRPAAATRPARRPCPRIRGGRMR